MRSANRGVKGSFLGVWTYFEGRQGRYEGKRVRVREKAPAVMYVVAVHSVWLSSRWMLLVVLSLY
jgi:hypothetical protein